MNPLIRITMFAAITALVAKIIYSASTRVQTAYKSQIGVKETGGQNKGPQVEKYLKNVSLEPGYSWCSAFVRWCFDQAGVKTKIDGWSPTAENRNNLVYKDGKWLQDPQPGDVFTLYSPAKKRIIHTGFVDTNQRLKIIPTVEGNTNTDGSVNGDGVYKRARNINTLHSISRWV